MKERINRLARGIIDSERPEMEWQPEIAEDSVPAGTVTQKELYVNSRNRMNVKGFIYSSAPRVRITPGSTSFGGLRNRIAYEVDTSYMNPGERLEGEFHLVTNCGEQEIPFEFIVDSGAPGEVIAGLKEPKDFLNIAERDQETALRLLNYHDFIRAPFMQDLNVRAWYDGFAGHGSRQNFMEEFLISIGVKKPIRLMTDDHKRRYDNPEERLEDEIIIRADSWGYIYLEAEADGDFIYLPRKNATQADFTELALHLPFVILPERLHAGRNLGAIRIRSTRLNAVIPVEVVRPGSEERKVLRRQKELRAYLTERLRMEQENDFDRHSRGKLAKMLDRLRVFESDERLTAFLQADLDVMAGKEKPILLLDMLTEFGCSSSRGETAGDHLMGLLEAMPPAEEPVKEGRGARGQKNEPEEPRDYNLPMLENLFANGCRSPFLYEAALKVFEHYPEEIGEFGLFEILTLYYGARKHTVSRELALRCAQGIGNARRYSPVAARLLMALYNLYPEKDILTAVCAVLIRGEKRGERFFPWYERAIQKDVSLTRIYEYYLFSLPKDYGKLLPAKVLLYFSYTQDLDTQSREKLYSNILRFSSREDEICRDYTPVMERFALDELFKGRINSRLAVIYSHMIYEEQIDGHLAQTLPAILRATMVRCRIPDMKYVVVLHEELMEEDAYPLDNGHAYVPLFSDSDKILLQDGYGNRYASVRYEKTPAMENVDHLVELCLELYPEHPMLLVNACREASGHEEISGDEAVQLRRAVSTMRLHPLFREKLIASLTGYYVAKQKTSGISPEELAFLTSIDKKSLTGEQRSGICGILLDQQQYGEAWEMFRTYYLLDLDDRRLAGLASHAILDSLFAENTLLLHTGYRLLRAGMADSIILDYLCEHFNGTTEEMYRLLLQAVRDRVETYDLPERLVAQMLFTDSTEKLDVVFDIYASGDKTSENVVRAYFTVRSEEYFFHDKTATDRVFAYLEAAAESSAEKDKLPDIYLLALTKYYAHLSDLTEEQRELCQVLVDDLIASGKVFAYFKDLARFVLIPGDILDKEIIEFRCDRNLTPVLSIRILPEEEEFRIEEMRQVYHGIFIHEKVLFEGEIMEYRIETEDAEGNRTLASEGSISSREVKTRAAGNRFASLNEMSLALDMKNERDLRSKMIEYVKKDAAVGAIFTLE